MIYADNAATTKLEKEALEAMLPFLTDEYANPSQPYSFSRNVKKALKQARETIAACINAEPDEIYFTSGGTESDNWALKGTAFYNGFRKSIITSSFEHHAILNSCKQLEELGNPIAYIDPDENGIVKPERLKEIIHSPALVSIMLVNNELGTIQPIKQLAEIAHKYGALFHTDAVQAVGHISIDVKELGIDMLSASAHKFNGARGAGFLYIKKGTPIVPLMNGGAQENKSRAGTENVAAILAMAIALKNNCEHIEANRKHIQKLSDEFLTALKTEYKLNGINRYEGIHSLSFKNASGETLLHRLDLKGISISTGSACDSVNTQISHVLNAIKLDEEYAIGTIRVSFGKDNTIEEAVAVAKAIDSILMK